MKQKKMMTLIRHEQLSENTFRYVFQDKEGHAYTWRPEQEKWLPKNEWWLVSFELGETLQGEQHITHVRHLKKERKAS